MPKSADSSAAGYSGKTLIAKLGWKPEMSALAINPPEHYADLTEAAPIAQAEAAPKSGLFSFIHLFVRNADALSTMLPQLEPRLGEGGMIWVSWPKKTSPMFVDLTEDGIRAIALPMGLVDVKVCAVDDDWSGLKLMRRKAH
jgi:hypothetical protein